MKRFLKILRNITLIIVLFLISIVCLVNYTPFQNVVVHYATGVLSDKLKTKVSLQHVRLDLLNHILVQGLYVEDLSKDTLFYAGEVQVRLTDWFIFKKKPVLHYMALSDAYVNLYRTTASDSWNYEFIIDALSSTTPKKKDTTGNDFALDLKTIKLNNIRFKMDDGWGGEDMRCSLGNMELNAHNVDLKSKLVDIADLSVINMQFAVREYKKSVGDTVTNSDTSSSVMNDSIKVATPFNPEKWRIEVKKTTLKDCGFSYVDDEAKKNVDSTLFDETNLKIKNLQLSVNNINISGDTVHGDIAQFSATERCGFAIKQFKSKVSVSPVASICDNLLLETNYSKLKHYYAMHYTHFPSFLDYIDSVKMVGRLSECIIDSRDIAFFAPEVRQFPAILNVSGNAKGTVSDISAQKIDITDGINVVKGDIIVKGLPDIDKTVFKFTDGYVHTSGTGIFKYAPDLKNNENIDIGAITSANFSGSYEGLLQNFTVHGAITSNIGNISTDLKMSLPSFEAAKAEYSGFISVDNLQCGTLLRQSSVGNISMKENFSGKSFASDAQLKIDGIVSALSFNGYNYHTIATKGVLANKQFTGNLLVADSNLALEFDGKVDFSKSDLVVNSTAHVLNANFKALHFTADTITLAADFELNFHGDSIDNFLGYAKLYNIDMQRNRHQLDLDSINVNSTINADGKTITLASNDVSCFIKGNFQISKLPLSFQYYLSRYLPNYISVPSQVTPQQDFQFAINTTNLDSFFAVTFPLIRGFDNTTVSGSLNTTTHKFTLSGAVPFGAIGKFQMTNVALTTDGNLDVLGMNISVDNAAFGDSAFSGTLGITATLANDSLQFTIATTTPDTDASITLNGTISARKDSLFLNLAPSLFYLGPQEWAVNDGSSIVYADKYLSVKGLSLTSGLQKIAIYSPSHDNLSSIIVTTENLDLGQLGVWAGLGIYQPDGRLNGTIQVQDIFNHLYISSNLAATGVKMGTDTIGSINIIGSYDDDKKLINLDPQTGIFRDNASVAVYGDISFDSINNQGLDGKIKITNMPLSWSTPFLSGIMSHIGGTADGTITLSGTSLKPQLDGSVKVQNCAVRLDYLGVNYTMATANVHIDNHRISFGNVSIYDEAKNKGTLTGYFSHNLFKDMRMYIMLKSKKMEALNLASTENNYFYGNVIAGLDSFIIKGPFNNIDMHAYNVVPAAKSHIYLPFNTTGDFASYNYISFKTYGKIPEKMVRKSKNKMTITIDANLNNLAALSLIIDPLTGDAINAKGDGNIQMLISSNTDMRINGRYNINEGDYTYTFSSFSQLLPIKRTFNLTDGSYITFNGPFDAIDVNVDAIYPVKTRFYDLLTDAEKTTSTDQTDAQAPQMFDVILHMRDNLLNPHLTFNVKPEDERSVGTYPYLKLQQMDQIGDKDLFDQVTSLLLLGTFMSSAGFGGNTATAGAINNLSQLVSGLATSQLNTVVNKLLGGNKVNVAVKYTQYNYAGNSSADQSSGADISQLNLDISKNYLDDRLIVELGSTSDWGKPASATSNSNFNINGDFRIQYVLTPGGNMRVNCFRTSDYDVSLDRYIIRSGMGLSWRKSFDNLHELFTSNKKKATTAMKKDSTVIINGGNE